MKKLLLSAVTILSLTNGFTQTTVTFNCTGASTNWTVPPCVTSINVTVAGADGGGGLGGNGAVLTATIPVTPGQVIAMNVGCSGTSAGGAGSAGYGGGGQGFASTDGTVSYNSSGGGGASTITIGGVAYMIAAGGGGEGGGSGIVGGGVGGCATGGIGTSTFGGGATGGTQTAGGIGGTPWAATPPGGSNGGLGFGGMGGFWGTASGGGGGGGYYGGGGGGNDGCCTGANGGGGGGGGSSLVPAGGGCTAGTNNGPGFISVTYTTVPMVPTVNSPTICAGSTATLTAAGGTTYAWNTGSTANPYNVSPAVTTSYTVTATTGTCTGTAVSTVTVNPTPTVSAEPNLTYCAGAAVPANTFASTPVGATFNWTNSNAAIGLAASGATSLPAFTAINGTAAPITSTITITPTLGACVGIPLSFTITVNPLPTSTFTQSANQCLVGNSFNFTSTGSSGAGFTQTWNFGGAVVNTSTGISPGGITYALPGTYTITHVVTSTAGCTSTTTSTVTVFSNPTALAVTAVNATCGLNNGVINIGAVTGGSAPFSYSVNGGAYTATLSYPGFGPGTYTVIVKDANGCTFSTSITIGNSPGPTGLGVTTVNSTCGASNGIINIGVTTGGTAPYTFSVNGSAYTGSTSYAGFAAGTYTVIVKDANGCTFTTSATIVNSAGPTGLAVSTVNSTCGASNGTITIGAVTGGVPGYTYSVNGSAYTGTISYPGFAAGTYTVIVKDLNGCTFTTSATVVNTGGPTAFATTHVNASCGASNGSITMGAVTGGTPAYTYSVNGGPFSGTLTVTGFAAGTYSVVVKDANGCTFTTSVIITNSAGPTALAITSTNASCGLLTGTATIGAVTGGTAPYTYSFNGSAFTSTTTYSGLASGVYSVIVKDINGCTFTTSVNVGTNPGPTGLAVATTNSTCGVSNGVLTIGAVTSGTAPYSYSVNGSAFTATTVYGALAAGTYTVIVKDVNGCTFTVTATVINSPGPTALAVASVNSTCGANNGAINIGSVTGGTPAYTYSVNGNPFTTTTSYTGFGSGTYTVIVKDANGCTFSTTVTVANTSGPTALATTTVNSTCVGSNGIVNIGAVTGGTATFVYSFNGSPFTSTISYTGLAAGPYTVIVKDANGCTFTVTATVANTAGITGLAVTSTNASCGSSTGTITIGATSGGLAPYTYSFNGGAFLATTSYTGLAAGTYAVIVKDVNGCTYTTSVTIVNSTGPTALATSSTNALCGGSNGTITIGATTGGAAPYTYSFNGSAFTATTSYTGLAANTYTVIVKDANGCTFTTSVIVTNSAGPTALVVNTTNSTCGASNGTITIGAVTGGLAAYSYSVNASVFSSTTSYTGFAPGIYTVIVKDANGCTFTTSATVINSPGPTALAVASVNSTCGANNGVINIGSVTGGTPAYTYSVNGNPFSATTSYSGFGSGTYTVIVKDANGCTFTTTVVVVNTPGPTALVTTTVNSTCVGSNGIVNIGAVTGGTATYVYSFNGSPFTSTINYAGLAAGTYTIIVKDANGCTFNTTATVSLTTGPVALATSTTNSTCGNSNGIVTIGAVTGGVAPYTYSFNGGGFSATTSYTGNAAGTYNVIVKDANGCTFTTTATIANTPGPTALATTTTNTACGASTGTITVGATTGGTGPYTYSVNASLFTATTLYTGFAANTYTVIVKDANGCTFTTSATVANSSGPTALVVNTTNAACGASTGTITIGATTGGLAPYSYSVNGSAFTSTTSYTALAAGTYTVIVKDANGCTFNTTATVSPTFGPTALVVTNTNATCGLSNGTITVGAVSGGTAPFTYSVNGSGYTTTTAYTGFAAGTFTAIVKDANGCLFSTTTTLSNIAGPTAVATTLTNTTCSVSNGSVVIGLVTGGTSAYTYSFNASAFTATTTYNSLAAGTYSIVVKDANGCTFTTSVTLTNSAGPTALANTFTNPTCGNSNGTITLGAVTGGIPAYTYSFNGGGFSATSSFTSLAPGTYPIIVKDANGCTSTINVTITNIAGPTALATTTTNASCGSSTGSVTIGATTGGTAPYTYSFNGSAFTTTTSYPGLPANTYSVIVQDANGCQFTTSAVINSASGPTALATTFVSPTCGNNNGTVTIGATTGGVLPLSYSFNGSAFTTTLNYTGLTAGTYIIIVKDAGGCTFSTSVTLFNIAGPAAMAVTNTNTTCGSANGTLTIGTVTGGTLPYSYSVNASAFTATTNYTGLISGTYTIIVKDANGCTFTTTTTITNTPGPTAMVTTITNATCGNSNGAVALGAVTGGTPAYTYSFNASPFTSTISYTGLASGSYTIIVKDGNGCTYTTIANITSTPGPTALATTFTNPSCATSNGIITIGAVTGGTPIYTYSFNGGGFSATTSYTSLAPGIYSIIVQDANACQFTTTVTLTNIAGPTALATTSTNAACGSSNGAITIGATTGGTPAYTYSFNGSAFTATTSYPGLAANSYLIVVQDANGCQFTTTAVVNNASGPTALGVTFTDATCGNNNGTATIGVTTGGVLPLSYSFNGSAYSTTTVYSGLAPGTYSVIVKDANGCSFATSVTISNIAGPTTMAVTNTNTTCGSANGTISIGAVTGGTLPYTYSVNASAFTATTVYTTLVAGTYTVIVKDANGCTFSTTTTLTNTGGPTAIATTITNATCGNSNGAVALGAVTGGIPAYTYSFAGSAFTSTISYTGLASGSFIIIVKDANGCTFTTAANITNTPGPTAQATTTNPSSCGLSNGAVNIGATTGGTPAYTYSFNGGGYTATTSYTGLVAGTYPIIVQDGNGCQFTVNPIVLNVAGPTALATTHVNTTCGGANGSITIGATTGGTPPYTYSVNGSSLSATTTYPGLVANVYNVTVQDANGCQFTTTVSITDLSGLLASITAIINVSCNGGSNGSVTVTASGSLAPYSYSFNGGAFGASGTFSGLASGTYSITAKDANGCTIVVPVTITQPAVLSGVITAQTNVSCFGGTNGNVTVSASGGVNPYSYSLDGGAFGASPSFSGLSAGTHTITIKDGNGCTFIITVTITQPAALVLAGTSVSATCTAANGSATVTVSGGTPAYSYSWTPGAGSTAATYNSVTAGNYSVLVTDFNGCTQTLVVNVGSSPGGAAVISSSTNVTCAGANDGTATVSAGAGLTPPFTYSWSPGSQTTVTAISLAPANYICTVTDANGCISMPSVIITQPTVLSQTFTTTNVSCFAGNDGIITVNPAGGTPGYTYLWMPGSYTTQTVTGLTAGTYTCTFTDANGCTKIASIGITQPTGMTLTSNQTDASCSFANGSATVSVTGGTGPYSYLWSDPLAQTTATANNLASNTYVVTVTDANGCSQNLPVTIGNLAGPVATLFSSSNVLCRGDNTGSATVTVSGGVIPFTFLWSDGQTLPTATNLLAGTYTLVATDALGCIASISVTITEPTTLNLGVAGTNPTCFNSCNGSIISTPSGGVPPYSYSWSPSGLTTPSISGLCAGTYTLTITDANGCTSFATSTLSNPFAVAVSTTSTNVACSGLCNGTATATPTSGTGPFTYAWSDISTQTTQTATGLCSGTYTVTATDAGGCSATATAVITSPPSMNVSIATVGNNTCFNACDGFSSAAVVGGSAPYAYNWMPGGVAGASVNNLCAGTYTVTVTDVNGCSTSATVNITQPNALVASISSTNVTCYGACDGSANAVYIGGTGPYAFQWTPSFLTTPSIINQCAGVQNLTVTDANGCIAFAVATITEPTVLSVSTTTTNSNCGVANGTACAAITGGVPPFSYLWNDPAGQTASCANSISAGIYMISITDGQGCMVTGLANVNDNSAPIVTIPTSSNVTCNGAANGSAQAAIAGGIVPYNILWTPTGLTTAFINSLSGGIYSVVVTDSVGCIGIASVTINEPGVLVSGIISSSNVSCYLSCNGTATVGAGGGTTPYTYLWNDVATQTTAAATGLCAQGYAVTVTDANGCTSTSSTTITGPTALTVTLVSTTNVSCNGGNNGAITIIGNGGTPGYTYSWTPGIGSSPTVTGLIAGTYTVVVTDQNGCSTSLSVTITEPTAITLSSITNPSTCGNSNGFVSVTPSGGTPTYTYLWDDPSSQTSAIATSLPAATYNVIVTDNNGCSATLAVVLSDIAGPSISTISFSEPSCNGTSNGTATVIPTGGTPLYSYLWTGIGAQTTQMASALSAGLYSVTVTDNNGCTITGSVLIPQPTALQIIVSPTDTICIGESAMIYGAGFGGTPTYTYTWLPSSITGAGPNVVNPIVTAYYDVFATDFNGCISPVQTITLFVNPPIVVTATDVPVCSGSSVGISATAMGGNGGPYSFAWIPPTGLSDDSIYNPIATPLVTTNYIVYVDDGCTLPSYSAFDTATVTVNPLAVSSMFVTDTAGCAAFTTTFNGMSDIGTSYSWNFGDGSPDQTGEPVTHTYPTAGTYNVTLTVTTALGCTSSITNSGYIDVYPSPNAAFSTSPSEITQTAPQVNFTDLSTGAVAWDWDFESPNGIFTDTLQNPVYSYNDTGSYIIQLVVTNSFGCTDTAFNEIFVIPEYAMYVPNAFTPNNNDGLNQTFMPQGVGMDPNNFEMLIFDRWGKVIFKTTDINKGWDGRANNGEKVAQIDTYVWKIITKDSKGNDRQYIGTVTIVK